MTMKRVRPPGILPLELWDLLLPDGSILWDYMQSPQFGDLLHAVISQTWHGTAMTQSEGKVSETIRHFHTLYLTGGGAPAVLEAMKQGPWQQNILAKDTTFGAVAGGQHLLNAHDLRGWVLDVGQSGFKISDDSTRLQSARNWNLLPLREDVLTLDINEQRIALRQSLAGLLRQMHEATGTWPEAIVTALPSRLDDQGLPEGSSYAGMEGDIHLIPDAMKLAGMPEVPLFVLNDAELAAVSAQAEFDLPGPTLVLTIGFGVGGAFIRPS